MNQNIFINEAINLGITNYLSKINEDDFLTIIIRTLISIYGELDIINPYKTDTESGMGSFDENVMKFGYTIENLSLFKQNVMNFYLTKNQNPNKYFNEIEKQLIDMFYLKLNNVDKDKVDLESFKSLIQFNTKLNDSYSVDKEEIKRYFDYKNKMLNTNISYSKIENSLNKEAYEIVGYSYDNIISMNEIQLNNINQKVFEYFKIDATKEDKFIRLDQAVEFYKHFNLIDNNDKKIKENGYTEFLLLSTFVSISVLIISVIVGVLAR